MDVDLIFKIAAVGILVAVLNLLLVRSGREEQAMMTTLAGLVVVLMMLVQQISDLVSRKLSLLKELHEDETATAAQFLSHSNASTMSDVIISEISSSTFG